MKNMRLPLLICMGVFVFSSCGVKEEDTTASVDTVITPVSSSTSYEGYLQISEEEPTTADPQCTSNYYTIPLNIFDTLVKVAVQGDTSELVPSLASSWEISEDGLVYTFHLQPGVTFHNGEPLTSSDVRYTLTRMLTHPDSVQQSITEGIVGADALIAGDTDVLEGFEELSDTDFAVTLKQPYAVFLACLSTPGASILDETTTESAGDAFGQDPSRTVGTGPFVFSEWNRNSSIILEADKDCWSGPPACDGLVLSFVSDPEEERLLFEEKELDILDLENLGSEAEYFYRGDIYQDNLVQGPRVGIKYIALNESIEPLDDVRVRRALQISLDRQAILDAVYSSHGMLENGIFPHGLMGFNPDLPEIPYDPERAKNLLSEAGYPDGFDLQVLFEESDVSLKIMKLVSAMWGKIGVRASIETMPEDDFLTLRKAGEVACYISTWSADFNDPDNFMYTFFGSPENTRNRSLCYPDKTVMERVAKARMIVDQEERISEYQKLEEKIIQEDAAWIPLFSIMHTFAVQERVEGFKVAWNGWSSNCYRDVAVLQAGEE